MVIETQVSILRPHLNGKLKTFLTVLNSPPQRRLTELAFYARRNPRIFLIKVQNGQ